MEQIKLKATGRDLLGKKVKILRQKGQIPAILYGRNFKALPLILDKQEFLKIFHQAGEATIINLEIPDQKGQIKALIRDIQKDPVKDNIYHVDLYKVDMSQEIQTDIPLRFVGASPAVEEQEGNFISNKDTIEVECLPDKLVSEIEVDISKIKTFEDLIHISDLKIPEGIKVLDEPDEIIAQVTPPLSEEDLKAMEEESAATQEKEQIESIETKAEAEKADKETAESEEESSDKPQTESDNQSQDKKE